MGGSEYPRPEIEATPHPPDRRWGIGIVVLSVFEILTLVSLVPWSSVSFGKPAPSASPPMDGPEVFGAMLIAMLFVVGVVAIVLSALRLIAGIGVGKGRRWAFLVAAIASGLLLISYLPVAVSLVGIPFFLADAAMLIYCWRRLAGRSGPRPV